MGLPPENMPVTAYIDTGLTGSGIAIWKPFDNIYGVTLPTYAGVVTPRETQQGWLAKVNEVVDALILICDNYSVQEVRMEFPEYWQSDARGQTAVVRGDILKLAHFCGSLARACYRLHIDVDTITPGQWKGQLPKTIITTRISKVYETHGLLNEFMDMEVSSHALDAVGIGLWSQGYLNK